MTKIIKILAILFFPIFIISIFIFSYNVFKLHYQFAYQSAHVYQNSYSWQQHLVLDKINIFLNSIRENKYKTTIPKLKIYISEQSSKKLLSNLPVSTKKWVRSYLNYPKYKIDNLQEIRLRYRGDNPANWLKTKKFFKIKAKKNQLIKNSKNLEYHPYNAIKYFPYLLLKKMELTSQDSNLVEVYFNEQSRGLYFELEEIDESFLRNNKIMPINVYKGENNAAEFYIGLNRNLFNNSGLWSKISKFNQASSSFADLDQFLYQLNLNSAQSREFINDYIDLDYFSKFDAFLTMSGNYHHDFYHNMRIMLDPWSGKVNQLIVDPFMTDIKEINLDFAANDLSIFLNKNPEFIHKKYEWLYYYLNKKNIVEDITNHFNLIKEDLLILEKKEPYDQKFGDFYNSSLKMINLLKENKKFILNKLNSQPLSSWSKTDNGFEININDFTPLSNIDLTFNNLLPPKWIGIDLNYDNKISKFEPKFFIKNNKNNIKLPIALYSNRFKQNINTNFNGDSHKINHSETYFKFITENNTYPSQINSENYFNKKIFSIKELDFNSGVKKNTYNNIVYLNEKENEPVKKLSGKILVNNSLIIKDKVIIEPGTHFLIAPKKHIIFKNQVLMNGNFDNPILFSRKDNFSEPWGTVALIGKKTNGSLIKNAYFKDGSGGDFAQYKFTSMLSIHSSAETKILDSTFSDNKIYDDTIHLVYANNLLLKNLKIFNAFSDAIDIDISDEIIVENIEINNSGNDGIDLMESNLIINNINVYNSKDKCVSVGENSKAKIQNSILKNCNIGVASKDKSRAQINNSKILDNNIQLAAYAKNWRYGGGGEIEIFNSVIDSNQNLFVTSSDPEDMNKKVNKDLKQNSKINISNSKIIGKKNFLGKRININ